MKEDKQRHGSRAGQQGKTLEEPGKSLLSPEQERPREELAAVERGPFEEELQNVRWSARGRGGKHVRGGGASNSAKDLDAAAASTVEEQDETLVASPPHFCAVSFRGERGAYRFGTLIKG
jgi:hypothetical protein